MADLPLGSNPDAWRRTILLYLSDNPDRPLKTRALARALGVSEDDYADFRKLVREMLVAGELLLGPHRSLRAPEQERIVVGRFQASERGFGFVIVPGKADVYVPSSRTGRAIDGDQVAARLIEPHPRTGEPRGEIVRIIERAPLLWTGLLERIGEGWFVRPQGKSGAPLLRIEDPRAKNAEEGDLVVVEPIEHTLRQKTPRGVIVERLGDAGDAQNIINAVIRRFVIPDEFPDGVRREAQQAAAGFTGELTPDREDLRDLLMVTIDPQDARDFDDAVGIEPLADGRLRLGVHIADVANFVVRDGELDREALVRGNSVYFPGFVVPMLPELLSNGVCSLQPEQPRYAKSVFITYNTRGEVEQTRFCNSLIRSSARLTYEQVTLALEGTPGDIAPDVLELLHRTELLARRIRQRRIAEGMLVLALPEVELVLNHNGRVTDAGPADTSFSHTIIEMFMVEANEAVCRLFVSLNVPHLRRIHPPPQPESTGLLRHLRPLLGRDLPEELTRETIRMLLDTVRGKPEEQAVNFILLRSMAQAEYSPSFAGHFALASEHYCHFTSPIRRYPDLVIHRLLDAYLRDQLHQDERGREIEVIGELDLAAIGRQTSATERRAQQAEREVCNTLLLTLMETKLGETFPGVVTGVMPFGAFVQTRPHLAEGMIRVEDFGPDVWEFDERLAAFTGVHSRRQIFIGLRVDVVIASVDLVRQQLNLAPVGDEPMGVVRHAKRRDEKRKSKHAQAKRDRKRQQRRTKRRRGR